MIKQECIGIPDMILLLIKDKSRNSSVPRRGLFYQNEPDYYSGKFSFFVGQCMRSGHFL